MLNSGFWLKEANNNLFVFPIFSFMPSHLSNFLIQSFKMALIFWKTSPKFVFCFTLLSLLCYKLHCHSVKNIRWVFAYLLYSCINILKRTLLRWNLHDIKLTILKWAQWYLIHSQCWATTTLPSSKSFPSAEVQPLAREPVSPHSPSKHRSALCLHAFILDGSYHGTLQYVTITSGFFHLE